MHIIFNNRVWCLLQDLTGQLATSWEQPDPLTLIFHIRQGVMWTGNSNIGMAPRAFTANDAAGRIKPNLEGSKWRGNYYYFASFTATDASTLVIKMKTYSPDWYYRVGYGIKCEMIPPEEVAAPNGGALNWKNQVGTGPFILTDFVAGSYCSYTKNTNYWGSTTIKGKQYQTPFIQTLVYPIVTDDSSLTAAIRTGKIDLALGETETDKSSLPSTMTTFDYLKNNAYQVAFKCDSGIFSDVNVRRAMMIGTDLNAIAKAVYPLGQKSTPCLSARGILTFIHQSLKCLRQPRSYLLMIQLQHKRCWQLLVIPMALRFRYKPIRLKKILPLCWHRSGLNLM